MRRIAGVDRTVNKQLFDTLVFVNRKCFSEEVSEIKFTF